MNLPDNTQAAQPPQASPDEAIVYAMDCPAEAGGCGKTGTVKLIVGPGLKPQGYCQSCQKGWSVPESSLDQVRASYGEEARGNPQELFARYKFQGEPQTESESMQQTAQAAPPPPPPTAPPPPAAAAPTAAPPAPPPAAAPTTPVAPPAPPAPAMQAAPPPPPAVTTASPTQPPAPPTAPPPVATAPAPPAPPPAPPAAAPPAPAQEQTTAAAAPVPPAPPTAAPPAPPTAEAPEPVTEPEGGAQVMHPPAAPQADQTPRPPQHLQQDKSQLEDPGEEENESVKKLYDACTAINSGMAVLQASARLLLQAAMPRPENLDEPLGGNPFDEKGSFKNEHIIFEELTKEAWVPFEELIAKMNIAETTARNKVKSLDNLKGYKLHHHEETDSYCITRSE